MRETINDTIVDGRPLIQGDLQEVAATEISHPLGGCCITLD